MSLGLAALAFAAWALVLVASMAERWKLRFQCLIASIREERYLKILHRRLVVHIAVSFAIIVAIVIAARTKLVWTAIFLAAASSARAVGERVAREEPRAARVLSL